MDDVNVTRPTFDPTTFAVDYQPFLSKDILQDLSRQNDISTQQRFFTAMHYPNSDLQLFSHWDGERGLFFPPHRKRLLTKDTTGALKMWLRRHKKNPYPSKAEKIMLAILSKMTLTQVSTWFANARRRLKKDYPDDDDMGPQQDNTTICSDSSPYFSCND